MLGLCVRVLFLSVPVNPFLVDVDVARKMSGLGDNFEWTFKHGQYVPEVAARGPAMKHEIVLRFQAANDLPSRERVAKAELDPAVKAAVGLTRTRRAPRTGASKKRKAAGSAAGRGAGAGAEASSGGVATAGASSGSSGSATSSGSEGEGFLDEEEKAEWMEASADGPPPPAAPAEGPAARIDDNGKVFQGGKELGRVTMLWRNPTSPTMRVYCKAHQCIKFIAAKRNPYQSGAMKWLLRGHACADKGAHIAEFDRMVLQP